MSDVLATPAVASAPTDVAAVAEEVVSTLPEVDDAELDASEAEEFDTPEEIEAPAKAGDISKKQASEMKKKLKIKVDGEESEIDLDWNDEESLKREIQKARAFDKRSKEHASYKSQVEQALDLAKNDPEKFMEMLGLDVDAFAEKRLTRKIEEMQKSPEQVEQEKMRQELEELRKAKKEAEEKANQAALEKAKNEQAAAIESDISAALEDAKSFIPKGDPEVYAMVAQYMLMAMNKGYHNVTAKDVIPLVENRYKQQIAKLLGASSDEVLETILGKQRLDNYRKAKVQQKKVASKAATKPAIKDTGVRKPKEDKQEERFFAKDFLSLNPKRR